MLMFGTTRGARPLFTILCQRRSEVMFSNARSRRIARALKQRREWLADGASEPFDEENEYRDIRAREVGYHRLDDLVGFAELYWDGGSRIMMNLWFMTDLRTKWGSFAGRNLPATKRRYHLLLHGVEAGGFSLHGSTLRERRRAVHRALNYLEDCAERWRFHVDVSPERALVDVLALDVLFQREEGREISEEEGSRLDAMLDKALGGAAAPKRCVEAGGQGTPDPGGQNADRQDE